MSSEEHELDSFDEFEARPHDLPELDEQAPAGFNYMLVIGLIAAAVGIGFMVMDGFKSETYFYTVDQAMAQGPDLVGQTVRVKGIVEPGTVVGNDGELGRTFRIVENGKSIRVHYDKAMPDTFDENMEVVVLGEVDDSMTVQADEVMVKCPSRYEGNPPTATDKKGDQPRASL
jgi:cytochrome c-type biogenesis protein CcmE